MRGEVYDLNGRLVAASPLDGGVIDVNTLAGGMYVLKLYTADGKMQAVKFYK